VCQTVVHVVFWGQPSDDGFVICQQTHRAFGTGGHIMFPHLPLEHYVVLLCIHCFHGPSLSDFNTHMHYIHGAL